MPYSYVYESLALTSSSISEQPSTLRATLYNALGRPTGVYTFGTDLYDRCKAEKEGVCDDWLLSDFFTFCGSGEASE